MKVAIFLDNRGIKAVNCSEIELYNPGIGGTPYMFLLLAYYLNKNYKAELNLILILTEKQKISNDINYEVVKDEFEAVDYCVNNQIDILLIRTSNNIKLYKYIKKNKIKSITWSHNFINHHKTLKELYDNSFIKRNVFVGKEQLEYYIDDNIYSKSTYIYNLFNNENYRYNIENVENKKDIITYIGSLTKEKGFHVLARNWNKIRSKCNDVELHVIGSGNLYDRNDSSDIQNTFNRKYLKYFYDKNNNIDSSVKFHGILGKEKNSILKQTKVGISNPSGKTETFGITALEFQASGVPVVAKKCCGYLDTVENNKSGYLFKKDSEMVEKIVELIKNNKLNEEMSTNGIRYSSEKFNIKDTCDKWVELFREIYNDDLKMNPQDMIIRNQDFQFKKYKILIRKAIKDKKKNHLSYSYCRLLIRDYLKCIKMLKK